MAMKYLANFCISEALRVVLNIFIYEGTGPWFSLALPGSGSHCGGSWKGEGRREPAELGGRRGTELDLMFPHSSWEQLDFLEPNLKNLRVSCEEQRLLTAKSSFVAVKARPDVF